MSRSKTVSINIRKKKERINDKKKKIQFLALLSSNHKTRAMIHAFSIYGQYNSN